MNADGFLQLSMARVGHIEYTDRETLEPAEYYCKLPTDIDERDVVLCPCWLQEVQHAMLCFIKKRNVKNIKFMCLIAAKGIERSQEHPDVTYCAAVDEKFNEHGYIVPGLMMWGADFRHKVSWKGSVFVRPSWDEYLWILLSW